MKGKIILLGCTSILFFAVSCNNHVEDIKKEVWNAVTTINRHWAITENMDSLGLFIHPDMVVFYPDAKERMSGKSNIIESYRGYADYAQTIRFKETDPLIQLYNDNRTAVVTYYYDFEIKTPSGETEKFAGRDMYTLVKDGDTWIAVAQHYSPIPE